MPEETEPPNLHPVIVTVLLAAPGDDLKDARRIAEAAVRRAVGGALSASVVSTGQEEPATREIRVLHVGEINTAIRNGWVAVAPKK